MTTDIEVRISSGPDSIVLTGDEPIVILGPNGSGKTRHSIEMAQWNGADHIGAVRNIQLQADVGLMSSQQARTQLTNTLNRRRSRWWELSNEIDQLFAKLLAENSDSAVRYRDSVHTGNNPELEVTKLMKLGDAWKRLFPGRQIIFRGNQPIVVNEIGIATEYPAQQMSDGERVGLYLAGRVLDAESTLVIVDEPEVHFHSLLAARFWNELEGLRPECRFVYVTHDLPFALSRRNAKFIMIMPGSGPEEMQLQDGLPTDLVGALLGAASFSIHAKRIIFCEGHEGRSLDQSLYSEWFADADSAVVPVGSARQVIACVEAFGQSKLVTGVEAIGIVDRDYWPNKFIDALPEKVFVLPYHEVENVYCAEDVFKAVARHQGKSEDQADQLFEYFQEKARARFTPELVAKQISERFKKATEHQANTALNTSLIDADPKETKRKHVEAVDSTKWAITPSDLFDQEATLINEALTGSFEDFMRVMPGKVFIRDAAQAIGMTLPAYSGLICSALASEAGVTLEGLGKSIEAALQPQLPSRKLVGPPASE